MDLSIIVVNWNTHKLLRQCLEAVYGTLRGLDFDVWVVDNASTDGSARMVRDDFPQVRLIENAENLGFACANNQALSKCDGRYVLLLNSDAFVQFGAVQQLAEALEEDPHAGIAGPRLIYPDGCEQTSHGQLPSFRSEILSLLGWDRLTARSHLSSDPAEVVETGVVSGACLFARSQMLDEIGFLDDRFFMFSEEVDLCARAGQAGWKVLYVPSAQVIHIGGGSSELTAQRVLDLYAAKRQYFQKYQGDAAAHRLLTAMWVASCLKLVFYGLCSRPRARLWRQVVLKLNEL